MGKDNLLQINNLKYYYKTKAGFVRAVDDVSLKLGRGEALGLAGESGCGKTTLVKALLKILPPSCIYKGGKVYLKGRDITDLSDREMRDVRWKEISLIPQSAMNALDPVYRVGDQITEAILNHNKDITEKDAKNDGVRLFELVGLSADYLRSYPHELSGGMKQRVVIAMALALNPSLIIADEPTTALDVIVQAQILEKINELQQGYKGSLIMVTHDISVIAQTCDNIAVMYGGKIMEFGSVKEVIKDPHHPYTIGLKNAFPNLMGEKKPLISIPGSLPDMINPPRGCRFVGRCPFAIEGCHDREPEPTKHDTRIIACHRADDAERIKKLALDEKVWHRR